MTYKVLNLVNDMKFIRNRQLVVIKRGREFSVSDKEYQFLSQVYGMAVKGEKEYAVRVTAPVKAEPLSVVEEMPKKGKRKKK